MKICKICGCEIKEDDFFFEGAAIVNEGMENEHALCHSCLAESQDNGTVIQSVINIMANTAYASRMQIILLKLAFSC